MAHINEGSVSHQVNYTSSSKPPISSILVKTQPYIRSKTSSRSERWKSLAPLDDAEDDDAGYSEEDDSDVVLSEGDYEDDSDDDLFAENTDERITERDIKSLGEVLPLQIEYDVEEDINVHLGSDEELDDSEDDLRSLPDSDNEEGIHYPVFNPAVDFKAKIKLDLGLKFPSNTIFREALRYHAIDNGYNYYYLHNGSKRVSVYCVHRCGCEWKAGRRVKCTCEHKKCRFKVHCTKVKEEATFQIKSLRLEHNCGRQHQNNKVTSQYLAERFLDEWRDTPNWKLCDFMKRVRRVTGVEVGYYKCYYARQKAMQMIHGDASEQYKKVWDYAEAIKKYNPGSTAVVKVVGIENPPPLFQRLYICLQPCKEGFMAGCRPILGVDGCHLRGQYPGICLTAVSKDGNNNIFPVAWAIVEVENAETWVWFLELLVKDIASVTMAVTWVHERDVENITYMSDRQKGLLDAFNRVVPNAEIRFCCRHIWANFKRTFPGEIYRQCFWKAARATTKWHFDSQMESIKLLSIEAYKYLNNIPAFHWSRHAFTTRSKSGMLLNNSCESFNNILREARSKPILSMMEWIRRYVMKRCSAKRDGLKKFEGVIMPSVVKMVERASEEVRRCDVTQADIHEFEVDHLTTGEIYVVNLAQKTCGCYRWDLMGIPCYHALACIVRQRLNIEDFVHQAYHVSTYARTYAPAFYPMPGQNQWPKTSFPQPLPPPYKKMPGRPKQKKRVKEPGEDEERQLVIRPKKKNKCGNCGGIGHYKKTCKNPPKLPSDAPKSKGGRPKSAASKNQPTKTSKRQKTSATTPIVQQAAPNQTQNEDFSTQASTSATPSCISQAFGLGNQN